MSMRSIFIGIAINIKSLSRVDHSRTGIVTNPYLGKTDDLSAFTRDILCARTLMR